MKKLLLFLVLLPCLAFPQIDFRYARKGTFVPDWKRITLSQLQGLKSQGFDHVRIMPRALPNWLGQGKVEVAYSAEDLFAMAYVIRTCQLAKMRLNISGDTHGNVHEHNFNRFEEFLDMGNPISNFDFSYLVAPHVQIAQVVKNCEADRWVCLGPGNEWGVLKSYTKQKGGTDAQQRDRALKWLYALYDALIPSLWAVEDDLTLILGGPSYKGLAGPGDWQGLDLTKWTKGRTASRRPCYGLHDYSPDLVTRNGDRHKPFQTYRWPDSEGVWKTLARDSNLANYENGYVGWTKEAKLGQYRQVKAHFASQGIQVVLEEYGGIGELARDSEAYRAWTSDVEWAADQAGFVSKCLFER